MSTEFTREDRYIVFKLSDVERYLTDADRAHLAMMKNEIDAGRDCANKPPFKGLIVESDWPEYEPTWKAIEARVTGAQPAPSIPEGWKLVPIEPTPEMMLVAQKADHDHGNHEEWLEYDGEDVKRVYRAMLAASPESKPCP